MNPAAADDQEPFVWGADGTPSSIQRRRALAAALSKQGMDTSPIQHWTQGMARVMESLAGSMQDYYADRDEKAGKAGADAEWANALASMNFGGAASPAAASADGGGTPPKAAAIPPDQVRGIIDKYTPEALRPFAYAMAKGESGFRTDAVSPTGAKGLFQFTRGTGSHYGLVGEQGDARADPELNTQAFVKLTMDNAKGLKAALGRDPTFAELAAAHQQGLGGTLAMLKGQSAAPGNLAVNNIDPRSTPQAALEKIARHYGFAGGGGVFAMDGASSPTVAGGPVPVPVPRPAGAGAPPVEDLGPGPVANGAPTAMAGTTMSDAPVVGLPGAGVVNAPGMKVLPGGAVASDGSDNPYTHPLTASLPPTPGPGATVPPTVAPPAPSASAVPADVPTGPLATIAPTGTPAVASPAVAAPPVAAVPPTGQPAPSMPLRAGWDPNIAAQGFQPSAAFLARHGAILGHPAATAAPAAPGAPPTAGASPAPPGAGAAVPGAPGAPGAAVAAPPTVPGALGFGDPRVAAMFRVLSNPYSSPGAKAGANMMIQRLTKTPEFQHVSTPDGKILQIDPTGARPPTVVYDSGAGKDPKEYKPGSAIRNPDGSWSTVPGEDPQAAQMNQQKMIADRQAAAEFRKEFQALPSYKTFAQSLSPYRSMVGAYGRDTKAADLNMIYGLGKIMDPNSVVREGELQLAQDTGDAGTKLKALYATVFGGPRLTPQQRYELLAEANSRVMAAKEAFDTDTEGYKPIITRSGLAPEDVLLGFGDLPGMPEAPGAASDPAATPPPPPPPAVTVKDPGAVDIKNLPVGVPVTHNGMVSTKNQDGTVTVKMPSGKVFTFGPDGKQIGGAP